jgi:UDP-N-acetylmuramoylalanine--D-glutamate ligase
MTRPEWLDARGDELPWPRLHVLVTGIGISGTACAEVALRYGARVTVVDDAAASSHELRAAALRALGADVVLGDLSGVDSTAPDLVLTSPGWRPDHELLRTADRAGVPVWGEVELAWRLTPQSTSWLVVTGTNGKTTTTEMLAAMLAVAGVRGGAAGNIGRPLLAAVLEAPAPELLAVELSSFQLHWSSSLRPRAAAVLNVAPDHLDWHGSLAAYAAAKGKVFTPETFGVYGADDEWARRLVASLPVERRAGFAARPPEPGELGLEDLVLVDRAFGHGELLKMAELQVVGGHNVANALAASALALAAGLDVDSVRAALRGFVAGPHRNAVVRILDGVTYVNDSKATNPHAAAASLAAYERVVWIAGGLNKGLAFDDLVRDVRNHLVAAVLIGRCADEVRAALLRHAPDVPVVGAADLHTAVREAASRARPGDTVLLAPAAASMDMFRDYAERGDVFVDAVGALTQEGSE